MKKSLVALAALAATSAFAQSTVSIDGIFDVGYQSINYKGDNNNVKGFAGNGSSTSQINFRGTEDLGGGMKANFRFESDFNAVSTNANTGLASSTNATTAANSINSVGSTFGNGEVRVGLQGGFGRFDIGSVNYNSLSTFMTGQPFGTAIGSGFRTMYINDVQATSQVRAENAIRYQTPAFNGLTASLYKSYKQNKAGNQTPSSTATNGLNPQGNAFSTSLGAYDQQGTDEIGLNYAAGPIAASYSSLKVDTVGIPAIQSTGAAAGSTESTVNTMAGRYTMSNGLAFSVLNQTNKTNTSSVSTAATTFSATYTMGNLVLMAQTGSLKAKAGTYNGQKSTLTGLGADYNLSKRTAVYFRTESIDDKARGMNAAVNPAAIAGVPSAASAGVDQKFARTAIGLRHNF
jgi:predicted porin